MTLLWPNLSRRRRRRPPPPVLRFTPTAWAKFLFLRDAGPTEVAAFGRSHPDDRLLVEEIVLLRQRTTPLTVAFDDAAVADHFDAQVDRGHRPEQFARIWLHTHPGESAAPSRTDEATFARVFGGCDWAVMGILARGGATEARLRFAAGPTAALRIPMAVDVRPPFAGSDPERWAAEYAACVEILDERSRARPFAEWIDPCPDERPRAVAARRSPSPSSSGVSDADRSFCAAGRSRAAEQAE